MRGMRVLFDDEVGVEFHLFFLGGDDAGDHGYGRGGQANGLCGATHAGYLGLTTGRHTGAVPLRIERHDAAPDLEPVWTEVVEASFRPAGPDVRVVTADYEQAGLDLDQEHYRVRYCAAGFDNEDRDVDDPPERYLLQFWPAPPAPDRVVRETSRAAASWHTTARRSPPEPTAAERAEDARRRQEAKDRKLQEYRLAQEQVAWGGRLPGDDRFRCAAGAAQDIARVDRDLIDEIAAAEPHRQRAMAAWTARWSAGRAGLAEVDWIAEALDALDRGDPLPPSFADFPTASARLRGVPRERLVHLLIPVVLSGLRPIEARTLSPAVAMIWTVLATDEADPLVAALRTLKNALDGGPVDLDAFRAVLSGR